MNPPPAGEAAPKHQRVADLIATELTERGARRAFGVAGGEVLTLIDALSAAGVDYVTARHENAAGFMAEGHWHAGGGLPVLVATLGPGVTNAVNVAANALQDHVPLVILGGRVASDSPPVFTHQVIDQTAVFSPVTKAAITVSATNPLAGVRAALQLAQAEPRGPVYLDCPVDLMAASVPAAAPAAEPAPVARALPAAELLELQALLTTAERPLVLVGLQAIASASTVRAFLEAWGAPVIQTYKAKGVLAESHPLCLGAAGLSPRGDEVLLPLCQQADLVLLLGYDVVEMRSNWNAPFAPDTRVIALTPAATRGLDHQAQQIFEASLEATLPELALTGGAWPDARPLDARQELRSRFDASTTWGPSSAFATLQHHLEARPDAICTVDTGAHRILLAQSLRFERPGQLLHSTGFCTMACALPLAIGAKLAAPQSTVLAVIGDGGLEMGLGDLATLRDLQLSLPILVLDDSAYSLIEMKQRARALPARGVQLGSTDFPALAEALGGVGVSVRTQEELDGALDRAWLRAGFTLIHLPLPLGAYDGLI